MSSGSAAFPATKRRKLVDDGGMTDSSTANIIVHGHDDANVNNVDHHGSGNDNTSKVHDDDGSGGNGMLISTCNTTTKKQWITINSKESESLPLDKEQAVVVDDNDKHNHHGKLTTTSSSSSSSYRTAVWSARLNLGLGSNHSKNNNNIHSTSSSSSDLEKQFCSQPFTPPTTIPTIPTQTTQTTTTRWRTHQIAEDYISLASSILLPPIHLGPFGYCPSLGRYPIEQATTVGYLTSPLRRPTVVEKWNPYEIAMFEGALALHGKSFHTIQKHYVTTKTTKEIIEFYYIWKKTSHGRRWKVSFAEQGGGGGGGMDDSDNDDDDDESDDDDEDSASKSGDKRGENSSGAAGGSAGGNMDDEGKNRHAIINHHHHHGKNNGKKGVVVEDVTYSRERSHNNIPAQANR